MKDSLFLIIAGLLCAALAWMFWHFAGASGFSILTAIGFVYLIADNRRLRNLLKSKPQADKE